jgi:hypothetical protein
MFIDVAVVVACTTMVGRTVHQLGLPNWCIRAFTEGRNTMNDAERTLQNCAEWNIRERDRARQSGRSQDARRHQGNLDRLNRRLRELGHDNQRRQIERDREQRNREAPDGRYPGGELVG